MTTTAVQPANLLENFCTLQPRILEAAYLCKSAFPWLSMAGSHV